MFFNIFPVRPLLDVCSSVPKRVQKVAHGCLSLEKLLRQEKRYSHRLILRGAFDIDLDLLAKRACRFDQRVQLNGYIARVQYAVELRPAGGYLPIGSSPSCASEKTVLMSS